jgi:hypothetical protein
MKLNLLLGLEENDIYTVGSRMRRPDDMVALAHRRTHYHKFCEIVLH